MAISADETKKQRIEKMGRELGEVYNELWQEVVWLHLKWNEYVTLFGKEESRVELLNKAAATFFRVVQDVLVEDIILHIARLIDKPETMKKKNLTILALPSLISDADTKSKVEDLIKEAKRKAKFCTDWRNRRLAHRDLDLALNQRAHPLKNASRKKINEALSGIGSVIKAVSQQYMGIADCILKPVGVHFNAETLIGIIEDGIRFRKERQQRRRKSITRSEDMQ